MDKMKVIKMIFNINYMLILYFSLHCKNQFSASNESATRKKPTSLQKEMF